MTVLVERMSRELNVDQSFILKIARNRDHYYCRYSIKKKNGGKRWICHPSPILKTFQYWLVKNIFSHIDVSPYAYAYRRDYSIKKNAKQHKNASHLLHMDIFKCFESIKESHVLELLDENQSLLKLSNDDINLVLDLTLYKKVLPMGSVSAPMISNCVLSKLDYAIVAVISRIGSITYTRYADDMVFSSANYIPNELVDEISRVVEANGFTINSEKTYFMSSKGRKVVTGLTVDQGKVSIGTRRKKMIKQMVYKKLRYGVGDSNQILGYLYFLKDIEPDYFNRIIIKYSHFGNVIGKLKKDIHETSKELLPHSEVAASNEPLQMLDIEP